MSSWYEKNALPAPVRQKVSKLAEGEYTILLF